MSQRFSDQMLRRLRNEVSFPKLFASLHWPHKRRGKQLAFLCPQCQETRSDLNPQENLVRCFTCETNFNPIDFTIQAKQCDFVEAVKFLMQVLEKNPP